MFTTILQLRDAGAGNRTQAPIISDVHELTVCLLPAHTHFNMMATTSCMFAGSYGRVYKPENYHPAVWGSPVASHTHDDVLSGQLILLSNLSFCALLVIYSQCGISQLNPGVHGSLLHLGVTEVQIHMVHNLIEWIMINQWWSRNMCNQLTMKSVP